MSQPIKFFDKIADIIHAGPDLLTTARSILLDTHEAREGTIAAIPEADYRAHVETTILDVANERLRRPLTEMLGDCLADVQAEHEMMEGPEPDDDPEMAWAKGLFYAICDTLEESDLPMTREMIQRTGPNAARIVETILAVPAVDPKPVLAKLGVTPEAVANLVADMRKPPSIEKTAAMEHPVDLRPLALLIREYIGSPGDAGDASEAAHYILSGDPKLLESGLAILEIFDSADEAMIRDLSVSMAGKDPDPLLGELAALVAMEDPAPELRKQAMDATPSILPTEEPKRRRRASGTTEESPKTIATRKAVEALCDLSAATEARVAEILGVSRSVMLNCRGGKAPLELDAAQAARVRDALCDYAKIADVLTEFTGTYQEILS